MLTALLWRFCKLDTYSGPSIYHALRTLVSVFNKLSVCGKEAHPTLFEQWCRSFYVPKEQISESATDGTYGFSSLSEKTRKSNRLQMSMQRQHFLLSYFKTLSVGLAGI